MKKEDLISFLKSFGLDDNSIDKIIGDKKLMVKNSNVFLVDKNKSFDENQVFDSGMIFIQLKELLPTTYLLNMVADFGFFIDVRSEKHALNFTYSKDLKKNMVQFNCEIIDSMNYVVKYDENVLGYSRAELKVRGLFVNVMNVGEYLKEG
jgi:hypothetical protein